MGACFDELTLDGKLTESEVKNAFKRYQDECGYESGNSYSGRLNMCSGLKFHNKICDNYNDAYEYVVNTAQKWEEAIAIQYKSSARFEPSKVLKSLQEKRRQMDEELYTLERQFRKIVSERLKSTEFITCKSCKSRMDTRFSKHTLRCPVCDSSFLSKKELKKKQTITEKIEALDKKIQERLKLEQLKANKKTGGKLVWYIGGWCSS